jgi:hypothetical protein
MVAVAQALQFVGWGEPEMVRLARNIEWLVLGLAVGVTSSPLKNIARLKSGGNIFPSKKVKWDDASLCVTPSTHSNHPIYQALAASE